MHVLGHRNVGHVARQLALGMLEHLLVGIAEVHRERRFGRHHIDEVGVEVEAAHRSHLRRADLVHHPPDERGHAGGDEPGVVAVRHGGGAGVVGLAVDDQLLP